MYGVSDKFRIRVYVRDIEHYRRFLPGSPLARANRRRSFPLRRRGIRLGHGARDSGRRDRAGPARPECPARLDKLDGAQLVQDRRDDPHATRGSMSSAASRSSAERRHRISQGVNHGRGHQRRVGRRQTQPGRLRGFHPGPAAGQDRRQPQYRARPLDLPAAAERPDRHRPDGGSLQARIAPSCLADATAVVNGFRKNETEMPGISNQVVDALDRGWHYATLLFGETQIRTGHLLVGDAEIDRAAARASSGLAGIRQDPGRRGRRQPPLDLGGIGRRTTFGRWTARGVAAGGRRGNDRRGRARRARPRSTAFSQDLTAKAKAGEHGSDSRPRRGNPPDRRRADAAAPEQPDPHRRGGRRQDRGRRGLRAAHRLGRRAAAAARGQAVRARRRPDAGRRLDEGRVRAAAAFGHRRGAGLADADHPVHRRGAHADRRGRRGGDGRRRESAQAGAGARHAAHDRRDHLGRIPAIFREGPGAHPALPADPGRRARCRDALRDAARHWSRPMEKHHKVRVSDEAIVAAVQSLPPLHSGAAIARQGGEPARHRLRARRDQPERQARRGRGRRGRDRRAREREGSRSRASATSALANEERIAEIDGEDRRAREQTLAELEADWDEGAGAGRGNPRAARENRQRRGAKPRRRRPLRKAAPAVGAERRSRRANGRRRRGLRAKVARARQDRARKADDLRPCRRAGGRLGGLRLDRHPRRPDGQGRDRDGSASRRNPQPAHHRTERTAWR